MVQPLPSLSHESSHISELKRVRGSPCQSPHKENRSPASKKRKPRTGTEIPLNHRNPISDHNKILNNNSSFNSKSTKIVVQDFLPNDQEVQSINELKHEINVYMLYKVFNTTNSTTKTVINIQDYFSCIRPTHSEKSNYYYLDILDAIADNKDTLMSSLYDLHEQFIQKKGCQYLVVTGDAKVYEKFQSLKIEYTGELHWLVPYPGDWHMLKNYQLALMKPYFDAGLKLWLPSTCHKTV